MSNPPDRPLIAGVDEAGRGCLAGPVAVAAVILDPGRDWSGIADSKQLSARRRRRLARRIRRWGLSFQVCLIDSATIDRINILQATLTGMQRAVAALGLVPELVLIDGNRAPPLEVPVRTVVGGDATEKCIGAASILAKTARDAYMIELDRRYPDYGFARHKGYATADHLAALHTLGPTPEHRRSFAPVYSTMQGELFADS